MTDPTLANYIAVASISAGGALTVKIVFDWLKNRNVNGCKVNGCKVNGCKDFTLADCFKWKTGIDKSLATHQSKLSDHEKRLDKGSADFDGIKKDISGINTSMAVFAEKLRKEDSKND